MESDFSIRNEIDSISHRDESFDQILNRYGKGNKGKEPTSTPPVREKSQNYLELLLSQLQSNINYLFSRNKSKFGEDPSTESTGFKLVVGPETLKWIALLLFIIIVLILLFKERRPRRRNPLKKKILKLESEIASLKRHNPLSAHSIIDEEL